MNRNSIPRNWKKLSLQTLRNKEWCMQEYLTFEDPWKSLKILMQNQNNAKQYTSTSVSSCSLLPCSKIAASIDVHRSRERLNSTLLSPQNPKKAGSMHAVWFLIGYPAFFFVLCSLKITLKFVLQNKKHQFQKTRVLISNPIIHKKVKKQQQINNFSLHAISQISGFKGSPHSTDPGVASHVEPPRHGTLNTWQPREFMEVYTPRGPRMQSSQMKV